MPHSHITFGMTALLCFFLALSSAASSLFSCALYSSSSSSSSSACLFSCVSWSSLVRCSCTTSFLSLFHFLCTPFAFLSSAISYHHLLIPSRSLYSSSIRFSQGLTCLLQVSRFPVAAALSDYGSSHANKACHSSLLVPRLAMCPRKPSVLSITITLTVSMPVLNLRSV